MSIKNQDYAFVRNKLLKKEEIAFLDVREEDPHAQEHPLFASYDAEWALPRLVLGGPPKMRWPVFMSPIESSVLQ